MNEHAQLARYGLFDARPPRYTSYPTAPHFSADIGDDAFRGWLGALPPESPASAYVHIPFCRRLCWFCACRTQGARTEKPIERYLDYLLREVATVADAAPRGVRLSRLHWGGGTPTILTPAQIDRLATALAAAFPLVEGAEFSIEIDPNEIDEARVEALRAAGMTRASIGVQDFEPAIQKAIGREQSFEATAAAAKSLRAAGIDSLNADLVYGLPGQTVDSLTRTIRRLLWLKPDRVALYGYAHVPKMARRQVMIPEGDLPGGPARFDLFEAARRVFCDAGYEQIGIDHFALPGDALAVAAQTGRLRRNFQGYTDDTATALIGLGASAISEFPGGYAQNAAATAAYQARIGERGLATARGHAFSAEDTARKAAIEQLMCAFELDISKIDPVAAPSLRAIAAEAVVAYPQALDWAGDRLRIRPEARALTRIVARCFDAYAGGEAVHSQAV